MHPGYIQVTSGSIFMKMVQNGLTRSLMSAQLSPFVLEVFVVES
jgi:hypothetical protein